MEKPDKALELVDEMYRTFYSDSPLATEEESYNCESFMQLYNQKATLFNIICKSFKERAWKSKRKPDGSIIGDSVFVVGITTPMGDCTYNCDLSHWDSYKVKSLELSPVEVEKKPSNIELLFSLFD